MASKSFANRRFRLSHSKNRSTIHRRGRTTKPSWSAILRDDLDNDVRGLGNPLVVVAAIGEDASHEGIGRARGAKERAAAVTILNARRMRFEDERASVRIHQGVALAPIDLLAGVVAARTPASVVLTLWLSIIAAEGLASHPTPSRSAMTRV